MINITLKKILAKQGITQQELSNLTNIRWPTINDMCNGRTKAISINNLNMICSVLECNPSDIITYTRTDADKNHTGFNRAEYLEKMQHLYPDKSEDQLIIHWP